MIPSSAERVPQHTSEEINQRIRSEMAESVRWHAAHPHDIDSRLRELDAEWDVERSLEANAATLSVIGAALGATLDKRFFALPAIVATFLLQHAIQGWCPPLPILRHLGFRTRREIETERYALKALRGDFDGVGSVGTDEAHRARVALRAATA